MLNCSIVFHMKTQFLFSCLFKTVLVKITQSSWEASGRVQASGQISQSLWGFPGGSDSKESICNAGDLGSILGWKDPLEEGMVIYSSMLAWRIPMDRGAWWGTVHGVTKSRTGLSNEAQHTVRTALGFWLFSISGDTIG